MHKYQNYPCFSKNVGNLLKSKVKNVILSNLERGGVAPACPGLPRPAPACLVCPGLFGLPRPASAYQHQKVVYLNSWQLSHHKNFQHIVYFLPKINNVTQDVIIFKLKKILLKLKFRSKVILVILQPFLQRK